ncbi:MAG: site-2 protease family protein [Patescibacteria group bacterium]|nr:site-2 protease family protein [Patescibacteria group bacterium]
MNDALIYIFQFIVFIFSVMVHEVSHGLMAYRLGDTTAKDAGRLNLNPLNHIDPLGSVILPLMLFIAGSPVLFGWAKPVPYNPYNLRNPRKGAALIGLAGPGSNFALALIFGVIIRIVSFAAPAAQGSPLVLLLSSVVFINLLLGIFNLVPIPPLDGSKLLFALLSPKYHELQGFLEQYGLWILIVFIFFGINALVPIINALFTLLTGTPIF